MAQRIYLVRDAEAGNVIDTFSSYEEAMEAIRSYEDIEESEWKAKADAQAIRCDAFDHSALMDEDSAKKVDGSMWIRNIYPCNKIAEVCWAEIIEEV